MKLAPSYTDLTRIRYFADLAVKTFPVKVYAIVALFDCLSRIYPFLKAGYVYKLDASGASAWSNQRISVFALRIQTNLASPFILKAI